MLHKDFQLDALPTELSPPSKKVTRIGLGLVVRLSVLSLKNDVIHLHSLHHALNIDLYDYDH